MKILYIATRINNEGGVARVISMKANYLANNFGHEVHILTQNADGNPSFYSFDEKIKMHDMTLKGNRISFFFQYKKALKNTLITVNPDVILVCDNGLKAYTIPYFLKTKTPIIFECHGSKYIEEKEQSSFRLPLKIKAKFKDFSAKKFNKFIALSDESLKEWNLKNGIVIPNPLWFTPIQFSDLKSKKVIAVGRHSYEKGLDRLLQIWQKVIVKHPDWQLDIYGKPNESQDLKKLAKSLNIQNNVTFFDPVKNINDKYLEASILALTSRTEGFGMVMIEAMACGLPVIAYDCPIGPRAIISNNIDGYLIENGNKELFVEKISELMDNESKRANFGENAMKSIHKYNLDSIMLQWKNLFEALKKHK